MLDGVQVAAALVEGGLQRIAVGPHRFEADCVEPLNDRLPAIIRGTRKAPPPLWVISGIDWDADAEHNVASIDGLPALDRG